MPAGDTFVISPVFESSIEITFGSIVAVIPDTELEAITPLVDILVDIPALAFDVVIPLVLTVVVVLA